MMKYAKTISLLTAALLCTSAFTACNPASAQANPAQPQVEQTAKKENPIPNILMDIAGVVPVKSKGRDNTIILLKNKNGEIEFGAVSFTTDKVKKLLKDYVDKPVPLRLLAEYMKVEKINLSGSAEDGIPDVPARLVKVSTQTIDDTDYFYAELTTNNFGNWSADGSVSVQSAALVEKAKKDPISLQLWNAALFVEKAKTEQQAGR